MRGNVGRRVPSSPSGDMQDGQEACPGIPMELFPLQSHQKWSKNIWKDRNFKKEMHLKKSIAITLAPGWVIPPLLRVGTQHSWDQPSPVFLCQASPGQDAPAREEEPKEDNGRERTLTETSGV